MGRKEIAREVIGSEIWKPQVKSPSVYTKLRVTLVDKLIAF